MTDGKALQILLHALTTADQKMTALMTGYHTGALSVVDGAVCVDAEWESGLMELEMLLSGEDVRAAVRRLNGETTERTRS